MNVPDKIYIHPSYEASGGWIATEMREYQPDDTWEQEYVRKDTLLEFLEGCKNNPVITDLQRGNIEELIKHIESL